MKNREFYVIFQFVLMVSLVGICESGSFIGVYSIPLNTTSIDGNMVGYTPTSTIEMQISIVNEEGKDAVFFPEEISKILEIVIAKDGGEIDARSIMIATPTKNKIQEITGVPCEGVFDDHQGICPLHPGEELKFNIEISRKDDTYFAPGLYELVFSLNRSLLSVESGDAWVGGGGKGGARFELRDAKGEIDRKYKLVILASGATRKGRFIEALEYYRGYYDLWPADPVGGSGIGLTLFRMGDYESSIPYLELAYQHVVDTGVSSTVPYSLAYSFVVVGKEDEALKVLGEHGSPHNAVKTVERMKKLIEREASPE